MDRTQVPRHGAAVSGRALLGTVALAVLLALAVGLATPPAVRWLAPSWGGIDRLAAIITAEVYLVVICAHLVGFGGWTGVRTRLRLGPVSGRDVALALAVTAAAWVAGAALYVALNPVLGWLGEIQGDLLWIGSDGGRLQNAGPVLLAVVLVRACLLAPLGEELLFRGSVFGWLRGRRGSGVAIATSAALFMVIHQLPVLFPLALILGLAAGWLRERTGSITPFLVTHILNNAALIVVAYFVAGWQVRAGAGLG
jgi:membrane protease YdiL (CAAX protease family)